MAAVPAIRCCDGGLICYCPSVRLSQIWTYIVQGSGISMRPMHHNISFQGINLDSLFLGYQKEQVRQRDMSHEVLSQMQEFLQYLT
jgi:hypothetical protein